MTSEEEIKMLKQRVCALEMNIIKLNTFIDGVNYAIDASKNAQTNCGQCGTILNNMPENGCSQSYCPNGLNP